MKKIRLLSVLALVSILICGFTGFAGKLFAEDKIVAVVNNDVITQKDLNDFLNFMRMDMQSQYRGQQLEDKIQSMKADLLDRLIEDKLILQEAKKGGIKTDDSRVKAKIAEIKKRYNSDMEFQDALNRQGLVQADVENKIKEQLLMYNVIDQKVKNSIVVKPSEVTEFFNSNPSEFKTPEQRELEVISTADQDLCKKIFLQLKDGSNLADLAKDNSLEIDKMNVYQGKELRKDIDEMVFRLKAGESTEPVNIEEKFYIFKLDNIIPSKAQSLSEAQESIHEFILNKKMQEKMVKWIAELKKNSYLKILQN